MDEAIAVYDEYVKSKGGEGEAGAPGDGVGGMMGAKMEEKAIETEAK